MPPKPKCTREEIARTAFDMIKKEGLAALTARELGKRLGTSASPIFTIFTNMEDVKQSARVLALREFQEYISDYREYTPAFKRIGMMMVSYGIHEPELFKLLFMQEHSEKNGVEGSVKDLGEVADVCVELVKKDYGLTHEQAKMLFEQMWMEAFGMGALCALRVCTLNEEEIGRRLSTVFAGLIMLIKSGHLNDIAGEVEKNTNGTFRGRMVGDLPFISKEEK